jgi:tRNA modification GTPase
MARGGEFTQRAFLNGKMDLTRAEAVADLIAAQSRAEKDLALSQLRGSVSERISELRERLLHLTSLLELELDFADHEELEFADRGELHSLADEIVETLRTLTDSFRTGNAIRNGIPVAIVGAPNAGKSTLLNALLGEERAIVSDIRGTTRDTIEDTLLLDGVLFRLTDTAGIHQTDDRLEQLGIERSRRAAQRARIILEVVDATCPVLSDAWPAEATVLRVWNKCDLAPGGPGLHISAKQGDISALRQRLVELA